MQVLERWGLHKENPEDRFIFHVVSDTTAVNPSFVKQMGYNWIPCAAHILHLVVQDALTRVLPLLQRHRNIVCCFVISSFLFSLFSLFSSFLLTFLLFFLAHLSFLLLTCFFSFLFLLISLRIVNRTDISRFAFSKSQQNKSNHC